MGKQRKRKKTGSKPDGHTGAKLQRDARGRAHLKILRDERGLPKRLVLSEPIFEDAWQNEVAVAAAATAHGHLAAGHTMTQTVELARKAMGATSSLISGVLANAPANRLACRSGCAHCCYQAVGVSTPEVITIYHHLCTTRSPDEREEVFQRIRVADDKTRGMASSERFSPELPCPFLDDQRCTIYEVRPLVCRGKNSLDAAACERTLHDAEARSQYLAGTLAVPCYLEPIRASHAVMAGLQLSLQDLHGLRMLPLELTAAMRILVDNPEAVSKRWLAGDDPFEAARGGDNTHDPRIRELSGRRVAI
jgi:hypothetical protein